MHIYCKVQLSISTIQQQGLASVLSCKRSSILVFGQFWQIVHPYFAERGLKSSQYSLNRVDVHFETTYIQKVTYHHSEGFQKNLLETSLTQKYPLLFKNKPNIPSGGRYCVIVYVGLFPTPLFGGLSVQSLYYTLIFQIFTPDSLTIICPCMVLRARCVNERGGGSHGWRRGILGLACKIMLARNLICQPKA